MIDGIILLAVLALLIFALRGTARHFKGEGACCSGGTKGLVKPRKKLKGAVKKRYLVKVSGMHCEHCKNTVEAALNQIQGAKGEVNLSKNQAVVSCHREIPRETVKKAVERAGFSVVSIEQMS